MLLPVLRPYQRDALTKASDAFRAGKRSVLVVIPTGGGKTVTASSGVHEAASRGMPVVWLAHRRELERQAAATLARFGLSVGCRGENAGAPIQVCSVQGILSRGEAPHARFVVLDEAHHFPSDEWRRVAQAYLQHARIIGLTATPQRGDGRALDVFDHLIVGATYKDLRELNEREPDQGLVYCTIIHPKGLVKSGTIATDPWLAWHMHAKGRSAVVFAPNRRSAEKFAQDFIDRGVGAVAVHYKLSQDERDARLHAFREGVYGRGPVRVICNVNVLTEGWDCPGAEVAIIAAPVGTAGGWIQRIGRVLRPCVESGKRSALVLDLVGAVEEYGGPDAEWEYSLQGSGIVKKGARNPDRFCVVCKSIVPLGAELCPNPACMHPIAQPLIPEVAGVALDKWDGLRKEATPQKRATMLASWMRELIARDKNPKSALYRYKGAFGHFPPAHVREVARGLVNGEA